jgi:hypothetical protein
METISKILGAPEICAILEASAKAKVSKLKFGDLEVEFGSAPTPARNPDRVVAETLYESNQHLKSPGWGYPSAPAPVTAITDEQKKMIAEALRREEVSLKDDQLANALVEDPVLAEELLEEELLNNTELRNDVPGPERT